LVEGDSAKAMAVSGVGSIPNGRDFYGIFPLKGKVMNVKTTST
jgi:DNA topoisomerase-2